MTAMPGPSAPAQQLLTQWSQIYMTAIPGPSAECAFYHSTVMAHLYKV